MLFRHFFGLVLPPSFVSGKMDRSGLSGTLLQDHRDWGRINFEITFFLTFKTSLSFSLSHSFARCLFASLFLVYVFFCNITGKKINLKGLNDKKNPFSVSLYISFSVSVSLRMSVSLPLPSFLYISLPSIFVICLICFLFLSYHL